RGWLEQALTGANEVGDTLGAAQARLALADLALEEHRTADALGFCGEGRAPFEREPPPPGEGRGRAAAGLAPPPAHPRTDARAAAAEADQALVHISSREVHENASIVLARARIELGELALARKSLEEALREASRLGLHHFELSAALALGQLELRAGAASAGRAR